MKMNQHAYLTYLTYLITLSPVTPTNLQYPSTKNLYYLDPRTREIWRKTGV